MDLGGMPLGDFGVRVDLTRRIRDVLTNCPEGTAALRELSQNIDDARASCVRLCLDSRAHGACSLLAPRSRSGRALPCSPTPTTARRPPRPGRPAARWAFFVTVELGFKLLRDLTVRWWLRIAIHKFVYNNVNTIVTVLSIIGVFTEIFKTILSLKQHYDSR